MRVKEPAIAYKAQNKIYTYEDYLTFPEDSWGVQIIEGELVVSPSPKTIHQAVLMNLSLAISAFVRNKKCGEVFFAPFDVILDNHNIVQPDILYISNENKDVLTEDNVKGAPDLIVEVLSQSTRQFDLLGKKDVYQKFGIKEYWIIDPENKSVAVYFLEKGQYAIYNQEEKEGIISSKILNGFKVSLKEIFNSPI